MMNIVMRSDLNIPRNLEMDQSRCLDGETKSLTLYRLTIWLLDDADGYRS
jgi:hypothetical protein